MAELVQAIEAGKLPRLQHLALDEVDIAPSGLSLSLSVLKKLSILVFSNSCSNLRYLSLRYNCCASDVLCSGRA